MGGEDEECGFDYACWWDLKSVLVSSSTLLSRVWVGIIEFWGILGRIAYFRIWEHGWEHGWDWVYHTQRLGFLGIMIWMGWDIWVYMDMIYDTNGGAGNTGQRGK